MSTSNPAGIDYPNTIDPLGHAVAIPRQDLPLTAGELRAQVNLIQEVMRSVMRDGEHYGKVPGCGDKPTLLQPGAQKLIMTFRLVPKPEITVLDMLQKPGHREYRLTMKLYARSMNGSELGAFLGEGVGTCSTMEGKYRYRTGPVEYTDKRVPKEYWDLRQTDPAKAKALLGAGHVAKKNDAGVWVCAIQGEKVEHDNPADYYNTCLKIAYKRALVSATLTVTAASDIFTQDIEEMEDLVIPTKATAMSTPTMTLTEKLKLKASKPAVPEVERSADFKAPDGTHGGPIKTGGPLPGGRSDERPGQPPEVPPPQTEDQAAGGAPAPTGSTVEPADKSGAPCGDASGSGPSFAQQAEFDLLIAKARLVESPKEQVQVENLAFECKELNACTDAQWATYIAVRDRKHAQFTAKKK